MGKLRTGILVTGVLLFLWFVIPFLAKGMINIGNLTGMAVSVIVFLYGFFLHPIHVKCKSMWESRSGKGILLAAAFCAAIILITVVAETVCMVRAVHCYPPENTTAVVLGCSVKGTRPSRILQERLDAAYEYLVENPQASAILSGGQGEGEEITEAECMYRYLTERGIAPERLYKEERSTTTAENLEYSVALMGQEGFSAEFTIITSEFHMYRAKMTAERMGYTVYSKPGHTFFIYLPTYYVRELYGILYYKIRG